LTRDYSNLRFSGRIQINMMKLFSPFIKDTTRGDVKRLQPIINQINSYEPEIQAYTDSELKAQFSKVKEEIQRGYQPIRPLEDTEEKKRKTQVLLEQHLPRVFAFTREASLRTLGMRHYDEQLIGGIILHQGKIAEMKTGEGKTLVATLPLVLNALIGEGAHLVTVNDYLARRDAGWNGPLFSLLGLTVASIGHEISHVFDADFMIEGETDPKLQHFKPVTRREAYLSDITYGTNNEFGFDYLRDNMERSVNQLRQRPYWFAIVDEVDSILIDEARTPLIISGPAAESASLYATFASIVPSLKKEEDYTVDEKQRAVSISDSGISKVETALNIERMYDAGNIVLVHHLEEALKAHALFKKNKDYVVKDGEVVIVDEFTGRMMPGRRYSEGLHQAIEAKEKVEVKRESETLATISFQNLFRLYPKLAGMTGTAATEAEEFFKIYKLDVVVVPTHRPIVRRDLQDLIYKNDAGKMQAVINDIAERQKNGQPVLVGTISVAKSERLSRLLTKTGIKHQVLNAKQHEREAKVIMQAGKPGTVTVATNMAGRGVDIILGGAPPVKEQEDSIDLDDQAMDAWQHDHAAVIEAGGVHVIGTERHESRRIDNQLRGRSGRQGDPGSTIFYISMEDDLMRIFGGERLKGMMDRLGLPEDQPITHGMVTKSIESAQKRVEGHNFDIRKHLVEYDDVMNKHREVIYRKRKRILMIEVPRLEGNNPYREPTWLHHELTELMTTEERETYQAKVDQYGLELVGQAERFIYLGTIDQFWVEHLNQMEELRTGIHLRGYGQVDPLVEYKREAYGMFERLLAAIEAEVVQTLLKMTINQNQPTPETETQPKPGNLQFQGADESLSGGGIIPTSENLDEAMEQVQNVAETQNTPASATPDPIYANVGRNTPCPCGSGRKFKKCHGK
jgi:preprotein translocase subunit SecA